jgi:hypothetical protein
VYICVALVKKEKSEEKKAEMIWGRMVRWREAE